MELDPLASMSDDAADRGRRGRKLVLRRVRWTSSRFLPAVCLLAFSACNGGAEQSGATVGIEPGNRAPELRGALPGGGEFHLASDTRGAVIVEFYRGSYCGLCRLQLTALEQSLPHFRRRGVEVVAATAEPSGLGGTGPDGLDVSFPTITVDSSTLRRWGVVDEAGTRGGTATYVVDRRGLIRFGHRGRNAADRVSEAELLTIIEQMANE